ncbi:MAG: hypothetical protein KF857_08550 [Fimbriimonadaceae bacterium]|nr:hypothetical protein [Fimbriimonadaceae bacterium]
MATSWTNRSKERRATEQAVEVKVLVEQAFMNLPEILTGSGYPSQDYEGGIVAAYALALLQELNGRNVNNPISALHMERPFRPRSTPLLTATGVPRYFRCDVHVDGSKARVGSRLLSLYGWRHSNWIEAKFFRCFEPTSGEPRASGNKDVNKGALLADLIRLLTLVPKTSSTRNPDVDICGRYLLHIYSRKPGDHLSLSFNSGNGNKRTERLWLKGLLKAGQNEVKTFKIDSEKPAVKDACGVGLATLEITFQSTCFVLEPLPIPADERTYHCVLARIDSFTVVNGGDSVTYSLGREVTEQPDGAQERIATFVTTHLTKKSKADDEKPPEEPAETYDGGAIDEPAPAPADVPVAPPDGAEAEV